MCTSPVIRLNPEYKMHRDTFVGVIRNGEFIANTPLGDGIHYRPYFFPRPYHEVIFEKRVNDKLIGHDNEGRPIYEYHIVTDKYKHYNVTEKDVENTFAVRPDGTFIPVWIGFSCGKCVECGIQKQKDWRSRMFLEQLCYDRPPLFVTLTYNDSNLPSDGVSKEDIAKFFNRLHLYCSRLVGPTEFPNDFRHVCFSEYGSLRHRPHYHAILFNFAYEWFCPDDLDIAIVKANEFIHKCWGKGFTLSKVVDSRAFHYVSKYVGKDISCGVPVGKNPNFCSSSRRFGGISLPVLSIKRFIDACATSDFPVLTFACPDGQLTHFTLPKYLRNKILPTLRQALPVKFMDKIVDSGRLAYACNILYTRTPDLYPRLSGMYQDFRKRFINDYPLLAHYFNYVNYSEKEPCIKELVDSGDLPGMINRLISNYNDCQLFKIDWKSVELLTLRTEVVMTTFVNKCQQYLQSLPKYSNFERNQFLLTKTFKEYELRNADGQ